ncbi:MAG: 4-aminobutyrate aminotransferase/(S)-3-amino-2-methylpropionate transaminase [Spirosomataceae bacterium]|jgi:4-aminobutyrate aminotransferase/(S)-3-amino-2-methylpropionate transaminase
MTKTITDQLFDRRTKVVSNGVGVFVRSSVVSATNGTIETQDGQTLIDFAGGIGVVNAGHCPPPVVEAIKAQAEKLIHACFHISSYEPYVELCEKLVDLFPHGEETKAMLTNTGAEAVENAIKIARQATKRQAILCYTDSFHGRSMMAMTLTSKIDYKKNCGPFAPEVYRLPYPNFYHNGTGLTEDQYADYELKRLYSSAKNLVDPTNIAAVIIEVVQGEGGFNPAPQKYLKGLRAFCDEYGIALIFDEVQSGFCRTGKWSAYEHYDVIPDLSTWAKSMGSGMPIGCVIGKKDVMDAAEPGTIGGTYLGNPVCCAASLATIKYMEDIDLNSMANKVAVIVHRRFTDLQQKCPSIGDVRGLGAMQAIEFVKEGDPEMPDGDTCSKLIAACLSRGLIILSAGTNKNIIRILSPLTISEETLNQGLDIIEEELIKITADNAPELEMAAHV